MKKYKVTMKVWYVGRESFQVEVEEERELLEASLSKFETKYSTIDVTDVDLYDFELIQDDGEKDE